MKRFTVIIDSNNNGANLLHEQVLDAILRMANEEQQFYFDCSINQTDLTSIACSKNPYPIPNKIDNDDPFRAISSLEEFKWLTIEVLINCARLVTTEVGNAELQHKAENLVQKIRCTESFVVTRHWFKRFYDGLEQAFKNAVYNAKEQKEIDNIKRVTGCTDLQSKWIFEQIKIIIDNAKEYFGQGKSNPGAVCLNADELYTAMCIQGDNWEPTIEDIVNQKFKNDNSLKLSGCRKLKEGYVWNNYTDRIVKFCFPFPYYPDDRRTYSLGEDEPVYYQMRPIMDPENYEFSRKPLDYINKQLKKAIPECNLWVAGFNYDWITIYNLDKVDEYKEY